MSGCGFCRLLLVALRRVAFQQMPNFLSGNAGAGLDPASRSYSVEGVAVVAPLVHRGAGQLVSIRVRGTASWRRTGDRDAFSRSLTMLRITVDRVVSAYRKVRNIRPLKGMWGRMDGDVLECCALSAVYCSGQFRQEGEKELLEKAKGGPSQKWAERVFGWAYMCGFANGWDGEEPAGQIERSRRLDKRFWRRYADGWNDGVSARLAVDPQGA